MKIFGYNGFTNEPLNLADKKAERSKIDGSRKMVQQSYKDFDKTITNSPTESINQKISLLEDTVKRHLDELLNILEKKYNFIVTTSIHDKSKIVVQLIDMESKDVKKEIPAENFLKMAQYIEDIFYISD